jgi:hypothetical protein
LPFTQDTGVRVPDSESIVLHHFGGTAVPVKCPISVITLCGINDFTVSQYIYFEPSGHFYDWESRLTLFKSLPLVLFMPRTAQIRPQRQTSQDHYLRPTNKHSQLLPRNKHQTQTFYPTSHVIFGLNPYKL